VAGLVLLFGMPAPAPEVMPVMLLEMPAAVPEPAPPKPAPPEPAAPELAPVSPAMATEAAPAEPPPEPPAAEVPPEPQPPLAEAMPVPEPVPPVPELAEPALAELPMPPPLPRPPAPQHRPAPPRPVAAAPAPAPAAAAPAPATVAPAPAAAPPATYITRLFAALERHKTYPQDARYRHVQGVAMLHFRMRRDGTVVAFRLERSAGDAALDAAVLAMIERASPLPAAPAELAGDSIELTVPVRFALR
jgi:protein TonB